MAPPPAQQPQPTARRRRHAAGLIGLLSCLALTGCVPGRELPNLLYIVGGSNSDQSITGDLMLEFRERLELLAGGYRNLQPSTRFQMAIYPEDAMVAEIGRRNKAGLGPDLLLVKGDTALQLLRVGLVDPFPASPSQLTQFNPEDLNRLKDSHGRLAGLPVLIQTQVACFNNKRIGAPPASLQELLNAGASGKRVGLTLDPYNLFWSLGSLGAINAFKQALAGQTPTPNERQAIKDWFTWLQNANSQQRITFYATQQEMEAEFIAQRLDWIPCRSTSLIQLRRSLGNDLGVAPLPDGEGQRASPINRLRVIALGRNSTGAARQRAVAFSRYSINPFTQRRLTLGSQTVLPANRFVQVPVQSSQVLRTFVTAEEQGRQATPLAAMLKSNDKRISLIKGLVTEQVFGEVNPDSATNELIEILQRNQ